MSSSLPQILRSSKSQILRPSKQGGIYSLKLQLSPQIIIKQSNSIVQPQEYFSTNLSKISENRGATSQTYRSQKLISLLGGQPRNTKSSQSQSRPPSRILISRRTYRDPHNQHRNGLTPKLQLILGQTTQVSIQNTQPLTKTVTQETQNLENLQKQLSDVTALQYQTHCCLQHLQQQFHQTIWNIEHQFSTQVSRLRNKLAEMRRNSGMEIKEIQEQMSSIACIAGQMDLGVGHLYRVCFK